MNSHPPATERFYDELWPHRAAVLRVARMLEKLEADADDLAQDAMIKAFRAIDSFAAGTNAKAWLMKILRNAHVDRLRARRPEEVALESIEVDPEDPREKAPDDPADWGDPNAVLAEFSDRQIIDALKTLPQEICWALLLFDVQGLDEQEAAEVLGIPKGTVKSRLHRGRRMLRDQLAPNAQARQIGGDQNRSRSETR